LSLPLLQILRFRAFAGFHLAKELLFESFFTTTRLLSPMFLDYPSVVRPLVVDPHPLDHSPLLESLDETFTQFELGVLSNALETLLLKFTALFRVCNVLEILSASLSELEIEISKRDRTPDFLHFLLYLFLDFKFGGLASLASVVLEPNVPPALLEFLLLVELEHAFTDESLSFLRVLAQIFKLFPELKHTQLVPCGVLLQDISLTG
jgi:hypothetical protein